MNEALHLTHPPTHLSRELDTLFSNYPIMVSHASTLAERGSFITLDVGRTPLLVNRDRNEVLRAFLNSCRHRCCGFIGLAGTPWKPINPESSAFMCTHQRMQ